MKIRNKTLSIVIPCKNEGDNIIKTLDTIYEQSFIENIDVIIADNSDDNYTFNLIIENTNKYSDKLNIKLIKGGYPSEARANGANMVESEYILFLDADIILLNNYLIFETVVEILYNDLDLVTVKFKTDKNYNYIYKIFHLLQNIGIFFNIVFAVGGFQLWKNKTYKKFGGYLPELLFAEDYWLSSKVKPEKFLISNNYVYTSSRRFKIKGIKYMIKMMILSYLNRNNIDFFKNHHNYWNSKLSTHAKRWDGL